MLGAKERAAGTAPKEQHQSQSYRKSTHSSSITAPSKRNIRVLRIKLIIDEILIAMERPSVSDYDRETLLIHVDRLLRRFIEVKYGL